VLQDLSSYDSKGGEPFAWRLPGQARVGHVPFDAIASQQSAVAGPTPFGGMAKRGFDLLVSLLLLPLATLVALPITCFVVLSGGNVIYGHARVGWNGRVFRCYKFRTMTVEAEHELHAILEQDEIARGQWLDRFKLENDPRVTALGRWLRKTCLDEVPQIWNVLRGDMSWVGPRPIVTEEMDKYGIFLPAYLACRPGITGIWQINRRSETTYSERVAMDVQYSRKWSAPRDLMIMLLTIPRMLFAGTRGQ
jgi:lipopolysaccharide/colanic/teichoic acid biosynthesis glycosyltransferase